MPTDVVMPQMGESITEGTITKWLKKPGDTVQRDEPLFEISTDKVDAEIPRPRPGYSRRSRSPRGRPSQINTVVAAIDRSGEPPRGLCELPQRPKPAAPAPLDSAETASTAPAAPGDRCRVPLAAGSRGRSLAGPAPTS